jgi:hypothetical protein
VTSGAKIHAGAFQVADPRISTHPRYRIMTLAEALALDLAADRPPPFIPIIIAADGTWHRPLTTLELAVLQSFPCDLQRRAARARRHKSHAVARSDRQCGPAGCRREDRRSSSLRALLLVVARRVHARQQRGVGRAAKGKRWSHDLCWSVSVGPARKAPRAVPLVRRQEQRRAADLARVRQRAELRRAVRRIARRVARAAEYSEGRDGQRQGRPDRELLAAVQHAPDEVARWADWPVNEADLHARHQWLVEQALPLTEKLIADPDYYDAKVAGWWVWGICTWIGGGWCTRRPAAASRPSLINVNGTACMRFDPADCRSPARPATASTRRRARSR